MNDKKFNEGDEVRVFDLNGKRQGQPEHGWPGRVEKVGRSLVTIAYAHGTQKFKMSDQRSNDAYGHQYFKTVKQAELDLRRQKATGVLRDYGIMLSTRSNMTLSGLESIVELLELLDSQNEIHLQER